MLEPIYQFLLCRTPESWIKKALENLDILLIDHAHCEKKAASTAMSLIYRYPEQIDLIQKLSKFTREEMRHFEQVLALIKKRGIEYRTLSPAHYAGELHRLASTSEPQKLIDTLLICAFIEARSCERFASILPHLDPEMAKFYSGLLASEARHFDTYLNFARALSEKGIDNRVAEFAVIERDLIQRPDEQFRFHSGS